MKALFLVSKQPATAVEKWTVALQSSGVPVRHVCGWSGPDGLGVRHQGSSCNLDTFLNVEDQSAEAHVAATFSACGSGPEQAAQLQQQLLLVTLEAIAEHQLLPRAGVVLLVWQPQVPADLVQACALPASLAVDPSLVRGILLLDPSPSLTVSVTHKALEGAGMQALSRKPVVLAPRTLQAPQAALQALLQLAEPLPAPPPPQPALPPHASVRIAVARDDAFNPPFYENLALLRQAGAQLTFFSPLYDTSLPAGTACLYLSSGPLEPERWQQLASNRPLLAAVRAFCDVGGLVLAEGAGLLYLSRTLDVDEDEGSNRRVFEMAGALPFKCSLLPAPSWAPVQLEVGPGNPLLPAAARPRGYMCALASVLLVEERQVLLGLGGVGMGGAMGKAQQQQQQPQLTTTYEARVLRPGGVAGDAAGGKAGAAASNGEAAGAHGHAANGKGGTHGEAGEARAESGAQGAAHGEEQEVVFPEGYCVHNVLASSCLAYMPSEPGLAAYVLHRAACVDVGGVAAAMAQQLGLGMGGKLQAAMASVGASSANSRVGSRRQSMQDMAAWGALQAAGASTGSMALGAGPGAGAGMGMGMGMAPVMGVPLGLPAIATGGDGHGGHGGAGGGVCAALLSPRHQYLLADGAACGGGSQHGACAGGCSAHGGSAASLPTGRRSMCASSPREGAAGGGLGAAAMGNGQAGGDASGSSTTTHAFSHLNPNHQHHAFGAGAGVIPSSTSGMGSARGSRVPSSNSLAGLCPGSGAGPASGPPSAWRPSVDFPAASSTHAPIVPSSAGYLQAGGQVQGVAVGGAAHLHGPPARQPSGLSACSLPTDPHPHRHAAAPAGTSPGSSVFGAGPPGPFPHLNRNTSLARELAAGELAAQGAALGAAGDGSGSLEYSFSLAAWAGRGDPASAAATQPPSDHPGAHAQGGHGGYDAGMEGFAAGGSRFAGASAAGFARKSASAGSGGNAAEAALVSAPGPARAHLHHAASTGSMVLPPHMQLPGAGGVRTGMNGGAGQAPVRGHSTDNDRSGLGRGPAGAGLGASLLGGGGGGGAGAFGARNSMSRPPSFRWVQAAKHSRRGSCDAALSGVEAEQQAAAQQQYAQQYEQLQYHQQQYAQPDLHQQAQAHQLQLQQQHLQHLLHAGPQGYGSAPQDLGYLQRALPLPGPPSSAGVGRQSTQGMGPGAAGWSNGGWPSAAAAARYGLSSYSAMAVAAAGGGVVCCAAGACEALVAMGLGNRLAGISSECDYPPDVCSSRRVVLGWVAQQEYSTQGAGRAGFRALGPMPPAAAAAAAGAAAASAAAAAVAAAGAGFLSVVGRLGGKLGGGEQGEYGRGRGQERGGGSGARGGSVGGGGSSGGASRLLLLDELALRQEPPGVLVLPDVGSLTPSERTQLEQALVQTGLVSPGGCGTVCSVLHCGCSSLADVMDFILELGAAAGDLPAASMLLERLQARIRRVMAAAALAAPALSGPGAGADRPPRVLVLRAMQPLVEPGRWVPEMLALVGATSCTTAPGGPDVTLSWADVRTRAAPDVLIILTPSAADGPTTTTTTSLSGASQHSHLMPPQLQLQHHHGSVSASGAGGGGANGTLSGGCNGNGGGPAHGCKTHGSVGGAPGGSDGSGVQGPRSLAQLYEQLAALAAQPGWWTLPAVRRSQVYLLHGAYCTRAGPRLVDGAELLARLLVPGYSSGRKVPPGVVMRLSLAAGQRCRSTLLPSYFVPMAFG